MVCQFFYADTDLNEHKKALELLSYCDNFQFLFVNSAMKSSEMRFLLCFYAVRMIEGVLIADQWIFFF